MISVRLFILFSVLFYFFIFIFYFLFLSFLFSTRISIFEGLDVCMALGKVPST